jgi:hypothetical protein
VPYKEPEVHRFWPTDMRRWLLLWGLLSALLMFGSLGPWLSVRWSADTGGQQGQGWLVLLAAVVGASSLAILRGRRVAGVSALLAGLVGLGVTLHAATHLNDLQAPDPYGMYGFFLKQSFANVGWGLEFAVIASFSLGLSGVVWLLVVEPPGERTTNAREASEGLAELH